MPKNVRPEDSSWWERHLLSPSAKLSALHRSETNGYEHKQLCGLVLGKIVFSGQCPEGCPRGSETIFPNLKAHNRLRALIRFRLPFYSVIS
jgi:hypothetical protein